MFRTLALDFRRSQAAFYHVSLAAVALLFVAHTSAQIAAPSAPQTMTETQIVDRMQRENQLRLQELQHYHSVRHYQVDYKGFGTSILAAMVVEASYDAANGKTFRIVSQTGSKALLDKVLKRALESEKEASNDLQANALTTANYTFSLEGTESLPTGPAYILSVKPLVSTKYLYRGKVWVDATEFAVVKMEVEPAKNPSFWISRADIHQTYVKTGRFWLPQTNRSISKIRVGGSAILTIDYGTYKVIPQSSDQVSGR
jgi:hypothetical protein